MEEKYVPVKVTDILPGFDADKLYELFKKHEEKTPKVETVDFLVKELHLSSEQIKSQDVFIRNYIYCTAIARKHLLEIEERIKTIKQKEGSIKDKESYPFKKLKYFEKKNESAKQQIVDFMCYGIIDYISARNDCYADLIDRNDEENMWIVGPTYDYQYNSQYYDPDYDFSTFAKFYSIPNVPLIEFLKHIEEMISLKATSISDFYIKVKESVENNDLLSTMVDRISSNYHMHQRKELFESLLELFNEGKYHSFVVNASIQLEGMFYELVSIKYGEKENQGTLVEKVDKAFNKSQILRHTLYPYFAFDVPNLRNQAAHKGLVETDNIEMLAYELILDLNCIISLIEKESIDKYKTVLIIKDKLDEVDYNCFENNEKYYMRLTEILLAELYKTYRIESPFFWDIISDPQKFEDELNYYIPDQKDENMVYLKDIVYAVSNLVRKEEFWHTVLNSCTDIFVDKSGLNDFGKFIEKLKNMFIPKLHGESKKLCCQINAKIQSIKTQVSQ